MFFFLENRTKSKSSCSALADRGKSIVDIFKESFHRNFWFQLEEWSHADAFHLPDNNKAIKTHMYKILFSKIYFPPMRSKMLPTF